MTDWFRSWHGAPTDPKWRTVARRAAVPTHVAIAVAWALMDHASQHGDRGSVEGFDCEVIGDFIDADPDQVRAVLAAMTDKNVLEDGRFRAWEKRQVSTREPIPQWLRRDIFAIFDACVYCASTDGPFEIDHVVPVSRGGSSDAGNLVLACRPCNRSKRDKLVEEWLQ